MTTQTRGLGLVDRMARTWADPRGATELEIAAADEPRLFFYAFAASVLAALTAVGEQALNPAPWPSEDPTQWLVTQVAVGAIFGPLGYYLAAGVIGLVCRWSGGTGSWRATRAATFWTAFVAAPAALTLALLGAAGTGLGGAPAALAEIAHALGSLVWALLLAPALAAAHGFRSARGIFLAFALMALGVAAAAVLL